MDSAVLANPPLRWLWPFSWYWRMRDLEVQNAVLKVKVRELDALFRASAVSQAANLAAYTAAVSSLAAMKVEQHRLG